MGDSRTVLVCGGRDYANIGRVMQVLDQLHASSPITLIVCGLAPGADTLAYDWARSRRVTGRGFRAMWQRDGKAAGPLRNQRMLDATSPDLVVAFPGGRGTADMVARARDAGVQVMEVRDA